MARFQWKMRLYFSLTASLSIFIQILLGVRYRGFVGDQMIFSGWMRELQQSGFANIYTHGQVDYPPIYLLVLDVYARLAAVLHWNIRLGGLGMKLPGIILYAIAMIFVYLMSRGIADKWRTFILLLFCFNPAIIFDTAIWGQVDILDGILALAAIVAIWKRPALAGVIFSVALLSKFQSIVVLPVLLTVVLRSALTAKSLRPLRPFFMGALVPLLLMGAVLQWNGELGAMIQHAYVATTGEYPRLSMNAMNIWFHLFGTSPNTLDTQVLLFGITFKMVGLLLLAVATLYVMAYLLMHEHLTVATFLKASAILSFAFFMLPTEIHERYGIMALIFALAVTFYDRRWTLLTLGLTLTSFFNLWTVCYATVSQTSDMWMVYLNVIVFIAMIVMTKKELVPLRTWRWALMMQRAKIVT